MLRMKQIGVLVTFLAFAQSSMLRAGDPDWIARGRAGMVAGDSPEASRIGAEVLRAGGNAFDAAVATSFALAVARPHSTGLGGGGFMLAYLAGEQRFVCLDFRESAPAAANSEYYRNLAERNSQGPSPSIYGGNAVAVPGQLAGLAEINRRFGTRPLGELIQPAIRLAEEGFLVDASWLEARREALDALKKWPQLEKPPFLLTKMLSPGGSDPRAGERLQRPASAHTLKLIAEQGPAAFYAGPIGTAIVEAVMQSGGILTANDLTNYRVIERQPLRVRHLPLGQTEAVEFVMMPPPSSGGVCVAQILNILSVCSLRSDLDPKQYQEHVLIEAMKHAMADRARWLGDPDFAKIPVTELISPKYGMERGRRITARTRPWTEYGTSALPPNDGGTSHFCVADRWGNVVAITETINGSFGSLIVVDPYEIILNNEMDDFMTIRGQANLFGLTQSEANRVEPGKRPLSSMSPTIIMRNGKPLLTLGASGGPRIITSTLQVALRVLEGRPLQDAMTDLRIHHQWQPDEVAFNRAPPEDLAGKLASFGHQIGAKPVTGIVQAIHFLEDGTVVGASDPQKGGRPAAE